MSRRAHPGDRRREQIKNRKQSKSDVKRLFQLRRVGLGKIRLLAQQ